MNFVDAMDLLSNGSKVTRKVWEDMYFKQNGADENKVKCYHKKIDLFIYDETIMVSDGWIIENEDGEKKFSEIIPYLQKGLKAKLNSWKECFIYLSNEGEILVQTMAVFPFSPSFEDFTSNDWIEIE